MTFSVAHWNTWDIYFLFISFGFYFIYVKAKAYGVYTMQEPSSLLGKIHRGISLVQIGIDPNNNSCEKYSLISLGSTTEYQYM